MSLADNSRDLLAQVERALPAARRRDLRHLRELRQPDRQGAPAGLPACDPVRDMQAARGAALSRDSAGPPSTAADGAARCSRPAVVLLADAISKVARRRARSTAATGRRARRSSTLRADPDPQRGAAFSVGTERHDRCSRSSRWAWWSSSCATARKLTQPAGWALDAGAAARRRARQPRRPAAARARAVARARRRLDQLPHFAGVQPRRLGHRRSAAALAVLLACAGRPRQSTAAAAAEPAAEE